MLAQNKSTNKYARIERMTDGEVIRYMPWLDDDLAMVEGYVSNMEHLDDLKENWQILPPELEHASVGDVVEDEDGYKRRVLMAQGVGEYRTVILSSINYYKSSLCVFITVHELRQSGYRLLPWEDEPDTIEVDGKKYRKEDVEERLKELDPVE